MIKHKAELGDPKSEVREDCSDSHNIERYIAQNKARLTNLDVCILNSMAKCYSKVERDQSRYQFAAKQNAPRLILDRCASLNSLITSFFKEETELLRADETRRPASEANKYFRLFNQSYTFERFE